MTSRALDPGLVVVVVYDGLSLFEFSCAFEVFGLARPELGERWYRFAMAAVESGWLSGSAGVQLQPAHGLEALRGARTVIVPGWRDVDAPVPAALCSALRLAHASGARILSICTGAFVLAATGLLDGRRATTHWRHAPALAARHPLVRVEAEALYVDEGSILTSAGSAAGIDLCLHLIRRDLGPRTANQVARRLVMPPHREGGQAQYIDSPVAARPGASLAPLLDSLRARLHEPWPVERMAAYTASSARSFQRHFVSTMGLPPGEWLLLQRLTQARALLEETSASIDSIAGQVGFGDAATLRGHFRKRLGTSPGSYRRLFDAAPALPVRGRATK